MAPTRSDQRLWERKLDGDMHIVEEQPQLRLYPSDLKELIDCVDYARNAPLRGIPQARGIGSHWCISEAGVSAGCMIETSTPVHEISGDQTAPRLNRALRNVIPRCLSSEAAMFFLYQDAPAFDPSVVPSHKETYLFHVEAGMRIHELYSYLDQDEGLVEESLASAIRELKKTSDAFVNLNADYSGPWALETMGGAGGQTIAGVISTATHGGDLRFGPISDSVVAMHLIDADGQQHWIERTRLRPSHLPLKLIDENKLKEQFPATQTHKEIQYHRDDDLMNAAVVACGRMGVIYSVVLRVVRQYALEEHWHKRDWSEVRGWLTDQYHSTFSVPNRFVQVDINAYGGFWHPSKHDCYVITRVLRELNAALDENGRIRGRDQRSGPNAGKTSPLGVGDGWFSNPCASDNWIRKALLEIKQDLESIRNKALAVWLAAAAVIVFPFTPPPIRAQALAVQGVAAGTIMTMQGLIGSIAYINALIGSHSIKFGETLAIVANTCALLRLFPILRQVYEWTAGMVHDLEDYTPAISYAQMDTHDYLNKGCVAPGNSIEIFFSADDPQLLDFLDLVLSRVQQLADGELEGGVAAFGGYISLRFMAQSEAFLAMQLWPRTCSIEIAGLSNVDGTDPLLRALEEDAKNFNAVLHWGQLNSWPMANVENWFDWKEPSGRLFKWRSALSTLSDHGRLALFSTNFSKHAGLEITKPIIKSFTASPISGCIHDKTTVAWDALSNPPETKATCTHLRENGSSVELPLQTLNGNREVSLLSGRSTLRLRLQRELNDKIYFDHDDLHVRGYLAGEAVSFSLIAIPRLVDGVNRWAAAIVELGQSYSNSLLVSQIQSSFGGIASWTLRNPETGDIQFATNQDTQLLASLPVFNKGWLLFSNPPVGAEQPPQVNVKFQFTCNH